MLWFGFLGGALAWLLHLVGAWLISEFGCVLAARNAADASISVTAIVLLILSVAMASVAVAATVVGRRASERLRGDDPGDGDRVGHFLAHGGAVMSGLFVFIIVVESIPIFYFIDHC